MERLELPPETARARILDFLEARRVMTLATTRDGTPWTCTVAFAHDATLRLVFVSDPATRHCVELRDNPRVAVAMHEPQTVYDRDRVRGLQAVGRARMLAGTAALGALRLYAARYTAGPAEALADLVRARGARVFEVRPDRVWMLDKAELGGRFEVVVGNGDGDGYGDGNGDGDGEGHGDGDGARDGHGSGT